MAKTKNSTEGSTAKKIGIGLAAGTALAAAAGTYFFYGAKDASKNRRRVKGWMLKARGEVLDGVEKLKEVDKSAYFALVDQVMRRYGTVKGISKQEAEEMVKELKDSWKHIEKGAKKETPKRKTTKSSTSKKK